VLELWFDFSCPYAYLASRRAPHVARAAGVELAWKPMLLGGVFRGIGSAAEGPMVSLAPAKALHNAHDMHRWAELFGAPFRLPAAHPMRTVRALRTLLALPHSRWPAAIEAIFAAYWQRAEDITQEAVIAAALRGAGVSEDDISAAARQVDDAAIKDELRRRTDEAIALGIFGAPGWVLRRPQGPLLIWGQDRIPWVDAALVGWDPDRDPPPAGARGFGTGVQGFTSPSTLDVYFDIASPFSYLGMTQLPALAQVTGVTPRLFPILLGALFRDIGQVDVPMFAMPEPKRRYIERELSRWSRWWGVPLAMPSKFPQRTVTAQRLCILAAQQSTETGLALANALGHAMWADNGNLEDDDTLRGVLADCGLPREWVERTRDADVKAALVASTARAKAAGVFGAPTFVVDEKYLFWGQDRLELVMRCLGGWRPEHG
jgi:2-hydroxychromene-2-carboxylate isomerase